MFRNIITMMFLVFNFIPTHSYASLIFEDYINIDDKQLVVDSNTSLSWLNLSQTSGMSLSHALNTHAGYRLATNAEANDLFSKVFVNFVANYQGDSSLDDGSGGYLGVPIYLDHYQEIDTWQSLMGTWFANNNDYSYGRYLSDDGLITYSMGARNGISGTSYIAGSDNLPHSMFNNIEEGHEFYGFFLVQERVNVSEPTTLSMFVLVTAFIFMRKRKVAY